VSGDGSDPDRDPTVIASGPRILLALRCSLDLTPLRALNTAMSAISGRHDVAVRRSATTSRRMRRRSTSSRRATPNASGCRPRRTESVVPSNGDRDDLGGFLLFDPTTSVVQWPLSRALPERRRPALPGRSFREFLRRRRTRHRAPRHARRGMDRARMSSTSTEGRARQHYTNGSCQISERAHPMPARRLFTDITEMKRRQAELERPNARPNPPTAKSQFVANMTTNCARPERHHRYSEMLIEKRPSSSRAPSSRPAKSRLPASISRSHQRHLDFSKIRPAR